MPWSTAGRNRRADRDAADVAAVSLHTGDPGAAGAVAEWTGGGYSRQAPSYGSAVAGVADLDTPLAFTGPASTVGAYVGLWATGDVFLGGFVRTSGDSAANASGEFNIPSLPITAAA